MTEVQVNSASQFIGFIVVEPLLPQQIILGIQTSSINYPMDKGITNNITHSETQGYNIT